MMEPLHGSETKLPAANADGTLHVLIADDHALLRSGLGLVLENAFPAVELFHAGDLPQALELLGRSPTLDLILLDLKMPGMDGFEGLRQVRQMAPQTPVAIISAYSDRELISEALKAGAKGYIPKASSETVLRHAVSLLTEGGTYIPPEILDGGM